MLAVNYGELFAGQIDNDGFGPIRDIIMTANERRREITELSVEVNVTGSGPGAPPRIVIQTAQAEPGRTPPRPMKFETIAASDPIDSGTWSRTFERADLGQFVRVGWRYPHTAWIATGSLGGVGEPDPDHRNLKPVLDNDNDAPRATRHLQVIGVGQPA